MKFSIESSVRVFKNIPEPFKDSTYWLWILFLLPVSAWRNNINIFPLAVGITDVINLVHTGSRDHSYYSLLFILSFARKNLGLLDSFWEEVRPFIETSSLLAACILTSKWFLLAAHFSYKQNLYIVPWVSIEQGIQHGFSCCQGLWILTDPPFKTRNIDINILGWLLWAFICYINLISSWSADQGYQPGSR